MQFYIISMEFLHGSLEDHFLVIRIPWLNTVITYYYFCRWSADVAPDEMSLATRSREKRLYSQARIIENYRRQRQTCIWLLKKQFFPLSSPN